MRRALALSLLLLLALALPAGAFADEQVSVKPRAGDVNTKFVFHGAGWEPNARLIESHGALCGTGPCILPLYVRRFEANSNGRFRLSERPTKYVPFDFEGYTACFRYADTDDHPSGCRVLVPISLAPPMVSATPALAQRNPNEVITATLAAQHFKAGTRLKFHVRYPGGRHRVLKAVARRHGAYVGPGNAWAPRGGAIRLLNIAADDPDGTYRVRAVDRRGHQALTSFVVQHYSD